jgi:hypothetical protein
MTSHFSPIITTGPKRERSKTAPASDEATKQEERYEKTLVSNESGGEVPPKSRAAPTTPPSRPCSQSCLFPDRHDIKLQPATLVEHVAEKISEAEDDRAVETELPVTMPPAGEKASNIDFFPTAILNDRKTRSKIVVFYEPGLRKNKRSQKKKMRARNGIPIHTTENRALRNVTSSTSASARSRYSSE